MNRYLKIDPWCIIEEEFNPDNNRASESIFSLGNGRFGQRANFEEQFSGETLQGNYLAGIYYPDKTKVGWWKNGYPEYFAKVLNAPNWIGLDITIENEVLDLEKCKVSEFRRILNMREGYLEREYLAELPSGKQIKASVVRFLSIDNPEIAAIRYSVVPLNFDGEIIFDSYIDAGIKNADANYDEYFWNVLDRDTSETKAFISASTRKTEFHCCIGSDTRIQSERINNIQSPSQIAKEKYVATKYVCPVKKENELVVYKYVSVLSSLYHEKTTLRKNAEAVLADSMKTGFEKLFADHKHAWKEIWEHSDISIEGDDEAQQAIRFNIFQLNQTYTGKDERLNIGPKGFTGEKYGGSTYWDTEAYCIPFFLSTAKPEVSRNLLKYRYKQLGKAIENAQKLGFNNGAALFPMVTMNGEECHNEWEITFEEIHRNGAIAFAIYNYVNHTNDREYLAHYGLEVLIAISRFWKQRATYSAEKKKYVILGVTGPNEYENNVNNNWYTNTIACWSMAYTIDAIQYVKNNHKARYESVLLATNFKESEEIRDWQEVVNNMYYPADDKFDVFLQQESYLDKEQITADELDPKHLPLNQNWSWDRILRSCFIKQADVLQGIYLFEDNYNTETIKRNFDFYESRTVHESSLSPCVHSILAARIGNIQKAYELYLRTSRLDLDDYNNEVNEGLHITSMAGTWMSVVEGFGGKRVKNNKLVLNPMIPDKWQTYSFKINFRECIIEVIVTHDSVRISKSDGNEISLHIYGKDFQLSGDKEIKVQTINYYSKDIYEKKTITNH